MNRRTQMLIAGAGAAAGFYAIRALERKHINTLPYGYGIKMKKAMTINCPPERLYGFWRELTNVPKLFDRLLSVDIIDGSLSHWMLRGPIGILLEWDAEITIDRQNEMIGWRSLDGAHVDNAGYVRFERATGGGGTVARVALQYNPPAGRLGAAAASLLGEKPTILVEEALRKLKQLMESGEIPTAGGEKNKQRRVEQVDVASEDSFPASDPPAWTGTDGPII